LIDYINSINGSFDNAKQALAFAKPLYNTVKFSKHFIRTRYGGDSEEEDEDGNVIVKNTP
jgi:hypothetical protein